MLSFSSTLNLYNIIQLISFTFHFIDKRVMRIVYLSPLAIDLTGTFERSTYNSDAMA